MICLPGVRGRQPPNAGQPPAAARMRTIPRKGTMDDNPTHDHEGYADHESNAPTPVIQDPANPWLPKTDWSRDGIIASDD